MTHLTIDILSIIKTLDKNNYRVVAEITDNKIYVKFPSVIQYPLKNKIHDTSYEVKNNKLFINDEEITVPTYAITQCISSHIINLCAKIGYNVLLIKYIKDKQSISELEFYDNLRLELDEEQTKKADLLKDLIVELFVNPEQIEKTLEKATSLDVEDGFTAVLQLLGCPQNE
jgi:hypothetical protein